MRQPVQVAVYAARVHHGAPEYLLLHRVPRLGMAAFWQGVTGGVEEGETPLEAALRELAEETGLVPVALERVDYTFSLPMEDQWRHLYAGGVEEIVEMVFLAIIDERHDPTLSSEHDRWRWCCLEKALGLLSYAGNIESLKACSRFLQARLAPGGDG